VTDGRRGAIYSGPAECRLNPPDISYVQEREIPRLMGEARFSGRHEPIPFSLQEPSLIRVRAVSDTEKKIASHLKSVFVLATMLVFTTSSGVQSQPQMISNNQASHKRPVTVGDGVGMTRLEAPDYYAETSPIAHFSPDGKRFVVVLRTGNLAHNSIDSSLHLYRTNQVFHSPESNLLLKMSSSSNRDAISKLRWLGDNETVVFLGENLGEASQIYKLNTRTRLLKKLTHHPTAVTNYDMTGDGRDIVFTADPPESQSTFPNQKSAKEIVIAGQDLFDTLTGNYSRREGQRVFWQPSGHSARAVLVGAEYFVFVTKISLSPDGRYVVFPASVREIPSGWANYANRVIQQVLKGNFPKGVITPFRQYLLLDTKDMSLAPLVNAPMLGFDTFSWAQDGKSAFLSSYLPLDVVDPVEREAREQNKDSIEVTLPSREYRKISGQEVPIARIQSPPLDVTIEQDVNTPPKLYVSDSKSGQRALLLDLNPQFDDLNFGVVRTIEWQVHGIETLGGLYLPPDYTPGKRYPLVIQTHGYEPSEFSMDGRSEWGSGFAARPLAAKGILVFQTFNFKNQLDHDRIANDKTLGATPEESFRNFQMLSYEGAIDYLDEQGLVDRDRIGIIGFSRTACFVGYALTHSKYRFAAATLVDGISCGYFEEIAIPGEAWDINNINGGASPFGKGLVTWLKNSPTFNLDKVRTPVRLVAHGDGSVLSAWEWYAGLSLQKKPVDLVLIPGAIHIGAKLYERMLAQQGVVDWFSFWLKGEEEPCPAKAEQYARWRELGKQQLQNSAQH
jgi:dipeptidyl aminopeptidase/acylaminoacyl peptidase